MAEHVILAAQTDLTLGVAKDISPLVDSADGKVMLFFAARNYVWDPIGLAWIKETQPGGGGGATTDVTDRVARLVGHVSLDTGGTLVGQKLMAASVPVVIASDQSGVPVTGTFFQASQPVSLAAGVDVTDRVARLLGVVASITAAVDVSDRATRLLGVAKIVDTAGVNQVAVSAANALKVDGSAVTQPVSIAVMPTTSVIGTLADNAANPITKEATLPARANAASPLWTEGAVEPLSVDLSGNLRVLASGTVTANQGTAAAVAWPVAIGIADSVGNSNVLALPGLGAAIATIAAPGAGVYKIDVTSYQSGTLSTLHANMQLQHGATVVATLLSTANSARQIFEPVTVLAAEAITVNATAADLTALAEYAATIVATRVV